MTPVDLDLTAYIIDVRDVIERYTELESASDGLPDAEERFILAGLLDALRGNGGDEHWRGDWYPITLIREDYFTEYARDLVDDCGDLPAIPSYVVIDWEATADNLRVDYSEIDVDGIAYLYR